ncbi:MAG: hypothetical protein U0R71_04970 [Solirubrobacterales bacterium]
MSAASDHDSSSAAPAQSGRLAPEELRSLVASGGLDTYERL